MSALFSRNGKRPKWTGNCSWCGREGDTSNLFCFSMVAGRHTQFCDPDKTDCLKSFLQPQEKPAGYFRHNQTSNDHGKRITGLRSPR